MICYRYNHSFNPPAPLVHVILHSPDGAAKSGELPAQLDIAADRSVIPLEAAEQMGLVPLEELPLAGLGGIVTTLPIYLVQIEIRQLRPIMVRAAASRGEPLALIGRDVLNHYRLLLDGPQLRLEIG